MEESLEKKVKRSLITKKGILGFAFGFTFAVIPLGYDPKQELDPEKLFLCTTLMSAAAIPYFEYLVSPVLYKGKTNTSDCVEYAAAVGAGVAVGECVKNYFFS